MYYYANIFNLADVVKRDIDLDEATPANIKNSPQSNGSYVYSGLDRANNTKGYIRENLVPSCKHCNRAKMARSAADFYVWASNLYHIFVDEKQGSVK